MDARERIRARQNAEAQRADRRARKQYQQKAAQNTEQLIRTALAQNNQKPMVPMWAGPLIEVCPRLKIVWSRQAPSQFERDPLHRAFHRLLNYSNLPIVRPLSEWKPQGKSPVSLFRSLAQHLRGKYPVPPFLWSVFFVVPENEGLLRAVLAVAAGESLFEQVKSGVFPVSFTRKMCHEFLHTPAEYSILDGIRLTQIKTYGGDLGLFRAFRGTEWATGIVQNESWWASVAQWFCSQAMLDRDQVRPLCDYLVFRKREEPGFEMKGRTAIALMKLMEEWHRDLNRRGQYRYTESYVERNYGPVKFLESGFKDGTWDESGSGNPKSKKIWRIREILSSNGLVDEGRAQSNCVSSYRWKVESGSTSIWALTKEDAEGNWAMLTVEVNNRTRSIVQARGRFNRRAEPVEITILNRWCGESGLTLAGHAV